MIFPSWRFFGTTNSGMRGLGVLSILARDQSMVGLAIQGPAAIRGYLGDLAGGVDQAYGLAWPNLLPDPDKFTWSVLGTATAGGR
jgi:hypothetical protein